MKKVKLFLLVALVFVASLFVTGCGQKNIEGSLEEIMEKVYVNVKDDEKPMMLENREVTEENVEQYLGTKDIEFKEALVSESGVGSIPHSVVLVRVKDGADVEEVKATIKENANPRKWICVEAENVLVESKGDLVILIMTNELIDDLKTGWENLK